MSDKSDMTTDIFAWLNQVNADARLPGSCLKVALQQTQKTNTAEFLRSGLLVTWQSMETISTAIGLSVRTVRDMVKRMEAGGHLRIDAGHGPGHSNRYTLILTMRQSAAALTDTNAAEDCRIAGDTSGSPLPLIGNQKRQSSVPNAAVQRIKTGSPLPPNDSSNNSDNSSRARTPSFEGLGALGASVRNRIGGDSFKAWLAQATIVSDIGATLTIALPSAYLADTVRQRFDDVLLQSAKAIDPKKLRIEIISRGVPA